MLWHTTSLALARPAERLLNSTAYKGSCFRITYRVNPVPGKESLQRLRSLLWRQFVPSLSVVVGGPGRFPRVTTEGGKLIVEQLAGFSGPEEAVVKRIVGPTTATLQRSSLFSGLRLEGYTQLY